MRRLSLFDIVVTFAMLVLLVYLGSREFPRYRERTIAPAPAPTKEVP